jgi:hypothetical protein
MCCLWLERVPRCRQQSDGQMKGELVVWEIGHAARPIPSYGFAQSCQVKPFTRENSETLAVTRVSWRARAWPAIKRS